MATFCYRDEDGKIHERHFPCGEAPQEIEIDGKPAKRSFSAEAYARNFVPTSKNWPLECYASGVHPSQAGELREHLRKCGVPTEVSRDGNPIYRNAMHRRRALRARGMFDKASYLG